ncbi:hypothetical protein [Rivihabitans pingtungensis]|uniref:hypothetical protein n=1 Tax=Rivihabitans pingtungensis TaxID=1054498 RepID=UPI0023547069|nr:hypothetical protein [Rivihabitans pingtungensis]MCK6435971.1 hypothetical protein [Rivihabitans pingtungensis]
MDDTAPSDVATTQVVFIDAVFKARTIVLTDGRAFVVEKSRISTDDPALIAHLDAHHDFERIAGE